MQKVFLASETEKYAQYIKTDIVEYIGFGRTETFESFDKYSLIAFDWYDTSDLSNEPAQILIYLDSEDIFFICENERSLNTVNELFTESGSNENCLRLFFRDLLSGSTDRIEALENKASVLDGRIENGTDRSQKAELSFLRSEIMKMKKYYGQLGFIFDGICGNENGLIEPEMLKYFEILRNRAERFNTLIDELSEYISHVREAYLAQISVEQNDVMKTFTMVTSILLPLSLIAGWYGMNVKMPEFEWDLGYPFVITVSAAVCIIWVIIFKRKKWM